ncbi:MAG: hypothetical protein JJU29_08615 [Verrucomicrobia bacterium]|nr:hypothetical protein [Verrucomicrobiota bacterium]MCH8514501.1 hypothetical protein [Kiritimatiellia bacterium]
MEPAKGGVVLLDTNVIIEAHRVSCWKALANAFTLQTVSRCVQEATDRRNQYRPGYVEVPSESLEGRIEVCGVTESDIARLQFRAPNVYDLDDGERDLLAYACIREAKWVLASPDHAVVQAMKTLELLDRFVSLEALLETAKIKPARTLRGNHRKDWLTRQLLK